MSESLTMDGWLGCAHKRLGWLYAGKNQRLHVAFHLQSLNHLLVSPLFSALSLPHPLPTSWSQTRTLSLANYCLTFQHGILQARIRECQ